MDQAVSSNGKCLRCKEVFGSGNICQECGVGRNRIVRRIRRHKVGGKRGRNSGTVSASKSKR